MPGREVLGGADVDDPELLRMAVRLVAGDAADPTGWELVEAIAGEVAYDLPAITTAGRYWVSGRVTAPDGAAAPFRLFVKVVQSWSRSPFFAYVPEPVREFAAASVPWRTEALIYRSDLGDRLPDGLVLPRTLGVFDLDESSAAVWLEAVSVTAHGWEIERYRRAAYLLGRLAASPRVAPLADIAAFGWDIAMYTEGRLRHDVLPKLSGEDGWSHPAVAASFGTELRDRLRAAADRLDELAGELRGMPRLASHGDACPNNLLGRPDPDEFTLIDFGFWMPQPVGFDLGQLLVGEVQLGRTPTAGVAATDAAITAAYVDGLRAEGCDLDAELVRRAHALQLLIFAGLSAVPFELLGADGTPELDRVVAERAALAGYSLDLEERTR